MSQGTLSLLAHRRFWPLFVSQFLGAANDNFFKNALIILVVYRLGEQAGMPPAVLATVAGGLFIAPYFLFSALAGELADRFDKTRLMRGWKLAEIPISTLGAAALVTGNVPLMLAALFLLGLQSTFTSPIKYAVLPEYLAADQLLAGNALIEGGTFLAILAGTIGGGTLVLVEDGPALTAAAMLALAVCGWVASLMLPPAHGGDARVVVRLGLVGPTLDLWRLVRGHGPLRAAVLGISWFWLVGATYLAQFPAFAKHVLGAESGVVTLMLTMFSVGIALGSLLCGRLLRGQVSGRHVAWAGLGMSLFAADLFLATAGAAQPGAARGLAQFLDAAASWRLLADLLGFAVCGGVFIVPLYALLQTESDEAVRARVVAANNVVNALFMVVGAGLAALLLGLGVGIPALFLGLGGLNLAVAWHLRKI